ncbi:glycoside hydrolase family 47 protein [Sporormia fimetaria CBS 119925]|uniref:alpha-1,2-Mannosidase n=1 Tax=Sporormia fimetaria CBS 119925 TaxID=1340428 RepID=A0A6A6VFI3_9PLEO|nr:glycoside hydrolase family 47 protein [Sporormia fimetaria CBS 119925]
MLGAVCQLRWLTLLLLVCWVTLAHGMTDDHISSLREDTTDIFYHGFKNYMDHAFPEDELRPLSCSPLTRDRANPAHIEVNDVLGNYSLTLIDSLSTLAILASSPPENERTPGANKPLRDFQDGVQTLVKNYGDGTQGPGGQGYRSRGFDLDSKVQVFETVIRGVGGLLSAHQFAVGDLPIRGYYPRAHEKEGKGGIFWDNGMVYDGQLLRLATDLANRLMPAFKTPTGLPYPRVNLRYGVPFYPNSPYNTEDGTDQCGNDPDAANEITETCSAGAGSLVLEFSTLSRLTGDPRYENAAKTAFWAVWERRSQIDLIGAGIDAETGQWVSSYTGVGAGIDSFFEYAFKAHILLSGLPVDSSRADVDSSDAFLRAWETAHFAIQRHVYRGQGSQHPYYAQADMYTGALRGFWIDSLSAYYQGLLTLAGELEEAIETHLLYTALWTRYGAMPERWSTTSGDIEHGLRWWGGRPEFIESTWYLYRATKDPWYLHIGEMAIRDIKRRCWTACGWAGLQDVRTGEQSDRMESFFLGETVKYLFLLFDPSHPLNTWDAPFVFTTEGHPLVIPQRLRQRNPSRGATSHLHTDSEPGICPLPPLPVALTFSATAARPDIFHAASLARLHLPSKEDIIGSALVNFNTESSSNYTYYPWTLPSSLLPPNGTSAIMETRNSFDLTFPNLPGALLQARIERVQGGLLLESLSGIRLSMVLEQGVPSAYSGFEEYEQYRIIAVSNIPLGRDEKVLVRSEALGGLDPIDPLFTRTRDIHKANIIINHSPLPPGFLADDWEDEGRAMIKETQFSGGTVPYDSQAAETNPSYYATILSSLQALMESPTAQVWRDFVTGTAQPVGQTVRHVLPAALPIGPGAAPLPPADDAGTTQDESKVTSWNKIYIHPNTLCNERLPPDIPRKYQIIVIPRGGCSFSAKLRNIPPFPPKPTSLQLVIIVSDPDSEDALKHKEQQPESESNTPEPDPEAHAPLPRPGDRGKNKAFLREEDEMYLELVQPYLHEPQYTPAGLPRHNPIPLIMVRGKMTMKVLERASEIAIQRTYHYRMRGIRIHNLFVV